MRHMRPFIGGPITSLSSPRGPEMEQVLEEARGNSKSIQACKRRIYGSQVVNIWAKLHIIYLIICVFLRDGDGERERERSVCFYMW